MSSWNHWWTLVSHIIVPELKDYFILPMFSSRGLVKKIWKHLEALHTHDTDSHFEWPISTALEPQPFSIGCALCAIFGTGRCWWFLRWVDILCCLGCFMWHLWLWHLRCLRQEPRKSWRSGTHWWRQCGTHTTHTWNHGNWCWICSMCGPKVQPRDGC